MVVDIARARLDNVDVLATDRVLDLASALATRELGENAITGRDAQEVADILCHLGVGVASQDDDVSNHCSGVADEQSRADCRRGGGVSN